MLKIIFVDIDETICITPQTEIRDYTKAMPIEENINKINKLYDDGNRIVYWTARGSRSGINWYEITKKQLETWNAKFHDLKCDKPYYDLFIEDRSLRIEEI
jgi:histidinol phosphatase-like enzyme